MRRVAYLVTFALLSVVAAFLTLRAQHTVAVVVATHDLKAGARVESSDVQVLNVHSDGAPVGSLATLDAATGRYVTWPVTGGEPVLARSLRTTPSGTSLTAGLDVPAGYRAVAVPVVPAGAVGGMLAAGDHVDVLATPQAAHDTTGSDKAGAAAQLLGHDILVLELRSDQGSSLDAGKGDSSTVHGLTFTSGKLGSVVLAVPADQVNQYAVAAATSTIYLALTVS